MKLFVILFLVYFVSIGPLHAFFGISNDELIYNSMLKSIKPIEKRHRISSSGLGVAGTTREGVRLLRISLERRGKKLTKEEARKLMLSIIEEFVDGMNRDPKFKSNISDYPISDKSLSIILINFDESGMDVYHPFIGEITFAGCISYNTYQPNSYNEVSKEEETYEEALAIVKGGNTMSAP